MEDEAIVALYWERKENAIGETEKKYGRYLMKTAYRILADEEDSKESVNDTYWKAWNSMPPHRPSVLSAFLGKITRNLSFNRYKCNTADKRGGGEAPAVLEEIAELVSNTDSVEQEIDRRELIKAIDAFLEQLPADKRSIFVCRYWYFDRIAHIASRFGMTENHVSVVLSRLRAKLHRYLLERGFEL